MGTTVTTTNRRPVGRVFILRQPVGIVANHVLDLIAPVPVDRIDQIGGGDDTPGHPGTSKDQRVLEHLSHLIRYCIESSVVAASFQE